MRIVHVNGYSSLSEEVTGALLNTEIEKGETAKWVRKLERLVVVTEQWANCLNTVDWEW